MTGLRHPLLLTAMGYQLGSWVAQAGTPADRDSVSRLVGVLALFFLLGITLLVVFFGAAFLLMRLWRRWTGPRSGTKKPTVYEDAWSQYRLPEADEGEHQGTWWNRE